MRFGWMVATTATGCTWIAIEATPCEDGSDETDCGATSPPVTSVVCTDADTEIVSTDVSCDPDDTLVTIAVNVRGDGGADRDAALFIAETNIGEDTSDQGLWSENHPLDIASGICLETLSAQLEVDQGWVTGFSTLFPCPGFFRSDPERLTYVVEVVGSERSCVAWGADPDGLLAGVYNDRLVQAPGFPISGCGVLP